MADAVGRDSLGDLEALKVFISYSRGDVEFADQLLIYLNDRGFRTLIDRHDIDGAEKWKERLSSLIFGCDTVVFVLTDHSAASPICAWEVEAAHRLGKRMIPVLPRKLEAGAPHQHLADLQWIYFFADPDRPGSGVFDGAMKLDRALRVDLSWLREQTRLNEQAALWSARGEDSHTADQRSSLLLRGPVLAEAFEWARRAPKGSVVSPLVLQYLEASAAGEAQANAEAQAQIAERTAALRRAEIAAEREREAQVAVALAQKRFRNVSYAAIIGSSVLALLALGLGYTALNTTVAVAKRAASQFAASAEELIEQKRYAEAMLIALHGDPDAQGQWETRLLRPSEGFEGVRDALVRAYELKTSAEGGAGAIGGLHVKDQIRLACENLSASGIPVLSAAEIPLLNSPLNREPCKSFWP